MYLQQLKECYGSSCHCKISRKLDFYPDRDLTAFSSMTLPVILRLALVDNGFYSPVAWSYCKEPILTKFSLHATLGITNVLDITERFAVDQFKILENKDR